MRKTVIGQQIDGTAVIPRVVRRPQSAPRSSTDTCRSPPPPRPDRAASAGPWPNPSPRLSRAAAQRLAAVPPPHGEARNRASAPSSSSIMTRGAGRAPAATAAGSKPSDREIGGRRSTRGRAQRAEAQARQRLPARTTTRRPGCPGGRTSSARWRCRAGRPRRRVVAMAPAVIRHAASSVSAVSKPRTFSHISTAATAADAAPIQASTRTLAHPGESTATRRIRATR